VLHSENNNLFPASQSAYRQFHSTETAVCIVHNDLVRSIDRGRVTALVMLDLSAAFDTVDHEVLLEILIVFQWAALPWNGLIPIKM